MSPRDSEGSRYQSFCRRAKLRCSRDKPSCAHCRKTGMVFCASVDSQDSSAREILVLLARELPKLVNGPNESPPRSWPPRETKPGSKRRRVHDDENDRWAFDCTDSVPLYAALLEETITAYFFHVHPWIPMIHEGRFRRRLEHENERAMLGVVIQAMVVAASKFVPNASIPAGLMARIRSRVVTTAMDNLCLESLQALIVVAYTDEREDNEYHPLCQPFEVLDHTSSCTELEERRRVFWNVFNLDRFCSVTMGWNTSLTSADVHWRLPCDGHLWRKEQAVATPYFGIWDKSAGRMGVPMGFLSMSRVVTYFLQQKVSMRNQQEISSWLTRFKELDLRLVHWKMLLPQKWKSNPNMTRPVPLMDPNLTLAHLIAYPPFHWPFRSRLPSSCSIEACHSAGIEIATISQRYLANSPQGCPVASQFAFCVFIAGRMLLIHWRYSSDNELPNEFWSLVQCLEEMARRWTGLSSIPADDQNLSGRYATRLKELYISCVRDDSFRISVADYTNEITHEVRTSYDPIQSRRSMTAREMCIHPSIPTPRVSNAGWPAQQTEPVPSARNFRGTSIDIPSVDNLEGVDLDTLPQMMLDENFMNMDRIIAFDDGSMFASTMDTGMF
ncbi:hypothetical protein P171DRAFT_512712 [Karstenula rhodostoma CBS 690.94]|uniref:Zn(2)-C6 fungal-type domain-containing protein n=1 Tax=Karstenula rhodostoma CBS 690.94 TaxID=1392251 RepID=A0A9P4PI40_9PLEO|nr:hypothetical protein P171DRAFT_512712 [Karstenula rhodostoma CBS 690.94]